MYNIVFLVIIACAVIFLQYGMRFLRVARLNRWLKKGMTAYADRHYDEAYTAFRKCVRIAPELLHAHTMLAVCLTHLGKMEEAQREMAFVRDMQPEHSETWALVTVYHALATPDTPEKMFEALEHLYTLDRLKTLELTKHPLFEPYWKMPRWKKLLKQIQTGNP